MLFYFSPKEAILSFAVTALRLRLRLLLGSDKVKQPAPCYQGKGHLFKVSGLFSTHHFYGTRRKSAIQILQTETEQQWSPFRHPCAAARPFLKPIPLFVSFNWLCRRFHLKTSGLLIWNIWISLWNDPLMSRIICYWHWGITVTLISYLKVRFPDTWCRQI